MQNYLEILIAVLTVFLIIAGEYLWLYRLSRKQETKQKQYKQTSREIDERLWLIINTTDQAEQAQAITDLQAYVKDSPMGMDILCEKISSATNQPQTSEAQRAAIIRLLHVINPVGYYSRELKNSDSYRKAYIFRKLADYPDPESIMSIRKFVGSKKKVLSYNAVMALATLGDEDSLVQFILNSQKEYLYSHRIILQILDAYTGDIEALAGVLLGQGDEYIRASVIKGIAKHRIRQFDSIYLLGLNSKNVDMKVACVRALGEIADSKYEHAMIVEVHDQNWEVRAAAADELHNFHTESSMQALEQALTDSVWWVRHNAACSLVAMDVTGKHVKEALNKYDKYANEAVRAALQKASILSRKERVEL